MYHFFYTIFVYTVFGIGAGIRYFYYLLIGKKKKYNDLIAPNSQSIWNILLSAIIIGIFIYFASKYNVRADDYPIDRLMNKPR